MDKKNTFIGTALIIAAIATLYLSNKYAPQRPPAPAPAPVAAAPQALASQAPAAEPVAPSGPQASFAAAHVDHTGAKITILENSFIRVRLTDFGGAIRDVALEKYPAAQGESAPFDFNRLHADPMLALVDFPGLDRSTRFDLVSETATEVVYRAVVNGRLEVTRRYVLSPDAVGATDPYQIRTETTFRNLSSEAAPPMRVSLSLGTAAQINPLEASAFDVPSTGYSDGKHQTFILRSKLEASGGMFGLGAHDAIPAIASPGPIVWGTIGNQFFAGIFTPDQPGAGMVTHRVKLGTEQLDTDRNAFGITGNIQLDVPALAPKGAFHKPDAPPPDVATLGGNYYVGPKEYRRLANTDAFKADQDKIMNFGTFKFFSELLLTLMTWIHSFMPNWGLAIVCTTLALKIVFLPLTLAASRSAKRMQKIQPQMKAIAEKYKDNPQKKNTATMELFKEHKVNPMGGCLPLLITFPFFFGFFAMLRSTAELRFAPFLWAHDLSAPDTVGHVFGVAINILPILLGITSFIQMRMTPQPTVDNAQAKMMMFTPIIFLVICYSYSCALSLYSTTNGIFTILQQLIINHMRDKGDPDEAPPGAGPGGRPPAFGGRPVKNITPGKKK